MGLSLDDSSLVRAGIVMHARGGIYGALKPLLEHVKNTAWQLSPRALQRDACPRDGVCGPSTPSDSVRSIATFSCGSAANACITRSAYGLPRHGRVPRRLACDGWDHICALCRPPRLDRAFVFPAYGTLTCTRAQSTWSIVEALLCPIRHGLDVPDPISPPRGGGIFDPRLPRAARQGVRGGGNRPRTIRPPLPVLHPPGGRRGLPPCPPVPVALGALFGPTMHLRVLPLTPQCV